MPSLQRTINNLEPRYYYSYVLKSVNLTAPLKRINSAVRTKSATQQMRCAYLARDISAAR